MFFLTPAIGRYADFCFFIVQFTLGHHYENANFPIFSCVLGGVTKKTSFLRWATTTILGVYVGKGGVKSSAKSTPKTPRNQTDRPLETPVNSGGKNVPQTDVKYLILGISNFRIFKKWVFSEGGSKR